MILLNGLFLFSTVILFLIYLFLFICLFVKKLFIKWILNDFQQINSQKPFSFIDVLLIFIVYIFNFSVMLNPKWNIKLTKRFQ